jgi:hypothetical protein
MAIFPEHIEFAHDSISKPATLPCNALKLQTDVSSVSDLAQSLHISQSLAHLSEEAVAC